MKEKNFAIIILIFLCIGMVLISFFSEGSGYGGGDSNMHMLMAKYSFKHPELFLNHWGKPFFILCSCLFAQFGFAGMNVFNIICALLTAWMMYLLAKEFKFENSLFVIFFSLFSPIYFVVIFSGLTEIFFNFVIVFSIFLFIRKKYILSSIVVSLLPFVRTEGYLLFPLFAFVLLYRKQFAAIFFLAFGTLCYSVIGGIYYHDWIWIIHKNPYASGQNLYGSGSLFFFPAQNEFIFGTSLVVLFLLGFVSFFLKGKMEKKFFPEITIEESFLMTGSFAVYFIAHTVFWWKGIFGSDGLIRVMAGVMPCIGLLSLRGANLILSFKNSAVIKVIIVMLVMVMPFKQHHFPKRLDYEEATIHRADDWIQKNNLSSKKIFYTYPFIPVELKKDPFDEQFMADFFSLNTEVPETAVRTGDIVIWDSHFSPNEGRIKLEKFSDNKNFKTLNSFGSDMSVTPEDKGRFEVYIFQKNYY